MKLSPKFGSLNRGKVLAFSIHFDPHRNVFFAGRVISGYVLLELKGPMEMRGIYIKLSGKVHVEWKSRKKRHMETDAIVEETVVLMDGMREAGTSKYSHPEGTKRYPFSFQLSPQLPSSFQGRYGSIQYMLRAKIEKAWKLDQKVERSFVVHQWIDPNEAKYSGIMEDVSEKEVPSACFLGGNVHLSSSLKRSCYCAGESIMFDANIENTTRKNLGKVRAKLVQNVTYTALGGSKVVANEVTLLVGPKISRNTNVRWTKPKVEIPNSSLPPTITNSNLLSVRYHLFVLVGKSKIVGNQYEIVVGTVPYVAGSANPTQGSVSPIESLAGPNHGSVSSTQGTATLTDRSISPTQPETETWRCTQSSTVTRAAGVTADIGTETGTGTMKRRAPLPPQWNNTNTMTTEQQQPQQQPQTAAQQTQSTQTQTAVQAPSDPSRQQQPQQQLPQQLPQPPQQQTQATQTPSPIPSAPPLSKAFSDPSFGLLAFNDPPPYYPGPEYSTDSREGCL